MKADGGLDQAGGRGDEVTFEGRSVGFPLELDVGVRGLDLHKLEQWRMKEHILIKVIQSWAA